MSFSRASGILLAIALQGTAACRQPPRLALEAGSPDLSPPVDAEPDAAAKVDAEAKVVPRITARRAQGHYVPNRAPLQPTPLMKLPIGAITPRGWLRDMLRMEAEGMVGHLDDADLSPYLEFDASAWTSVDGEGEYGWEELPYWLKGYGDLGYVLKDELITSAARRWIDAVLSSQRQDGYFGDRTLLTSLDGTPDMWAHMPMLNVLQSFYEATGDARVIDFMRRYFEWQNSRPASDFSAGYWPRMRFGDNIASIYWLYNRSGEPWLLDLARKIHENMVDWTSGIPDIHGVNIAQGFKEPAIYYQQAKEAKYLEAVEKNYLGVMESHGQFPGGGFAADEMMRTGFGDPRQGFETCSIVELMHSFEMLTRISGDPVWADRCEELAFNSLPAAMTPDLRALHYLTSANMVQLDAANKSPCIVNGGNMFAYSPVRFRCCQHNVSHGWPYYAEELWLATWDHGLLASLYAPSEVEAKVGPGEGSTVKLVEETTYPFSEAIRIEVRSSEPVSFPLYLRIPRWTESAVVSVNGRAVDVRPEPRSYVSLWRTWRGGDVVTLKLPMQVSLRAWERNMDAVSVEHGPLSFSLRIEETWKRSGGTETWPEHEVLPATPWNYGLLLDPADPAGSFEVRRKPGPLPRQPFDVRAAPIEILAKAKKIPEWTIDNVGLVGKLNQSPILSDEPEETVTLIPMGAARLRITAFPTIGEGADAQTWSTRMQCP